MSRVIQLNRLKEGWLYKKSKHVGSWRRRWVVLTYDTLKTYKENNEQNKPTEIISNDNTTMQLSSNLQNEDIFSIKSNTSFFEFKIEKASDKQEWMTAIQIFINRIKIPVQVECQRETLYNCNFILNSSYYDDSCCSLNAIIDNII
eukprot:514140_1